MPRDSKRVFDPSPKRRALLAALLQEEGISPSFLERITRRKPDDHPPLSYSQARLWYLDQFQPGTPAYNMPDAVRLKGKLDVAALERSLNEIVRRHEVLRTTFPTIEGQPVQAIAPTLILTLPVTDLRNLPESEREAEALRLVDEEAQRPFDLTRGSLLRTGLLQLEDEDHILLLNIHHIVSDGWSIGVFFRELAAIYESFSKGKPSLLPELSIQYADFAVWQQQWLQGEILETQLAYWKRQLGGDLPVLQLPTDRSRPPVQSLRGAHQSLTLPGSLIAALKTLNSREEVTLFMTLLAAFNVLLYKYTGQEDITVGSPIANRHRVETEGLIGLFANTLALRTDLSSSPTFRELLGRVREVALGAYANQDLPFERLVEEVQPERDLSRTPLFQVMFVLQDASMLALELPGLAVNRLAVGTGTAKYDLTLFIVDEAEGLSAYLEYNTDLFDDTTIKRMFSHFQTLLEAVVANPDQHISTLHLLTEAERHQLLVEWNDTTADYPRDACIHELFEDQVQRTPDAVAVVFKDELITYRELNRRANQLGHYLKKLGVGPEVVVGICVDRSLEMIVGMLGILKAGGAYLPLDPAYPKERLDFMLRDARVAVLLTQERLVGELPEHEAQLVRVDADWVAIAMESKQSLVSRTTSDNLAYVIYTSGSTGLPKGVLGLHRGVINRLDWMWRVYSFKADEICCQKTSLSFIDSIWEIFGPLLQGIQTVIIPDDIVKDPPRLVRVLARSQVTRIVVVPSLLRAILDAEIDLQRQLARLRYWVTSGESLSMELLRRFFEKLPQSILINLYGSSEVSADSTCYETSSNGSPPFVPIGQPIANTKIYLLDAHLQPVPVGVAGELYAGGTGLARGYLNRHELTAERFVPDPFSNEPGSRMYRTGDLARYLPDGNIEYLGRIDRQVKIRGHRVEPGEIEAALRQHEGIQEAVVTVHEDSPSDRRLVAYVTPRGETTPGITQLRSFLKKKLPEHMVPSFMVMLERLPLTPNGKVNRHALPAPDQMRPDLEKRFIAPRDSLELQLTKIWERVLGVQGIGVTDNFFELGGHSLLAVTLFAQIKKTFGRNLPLTDLFQAPTVEQLAEIIRQGGWSAPWSSLVSIQQGGSRPPFFCVHELSGSVLVYADLARYLGPDQPFYALQPQGLDKRQAPYTRIEDMADRYIQEIRSLQPEGPYYLGGYSFGGKVAFEMARQLVAAGQEVALLAFFDAHGPGYNNALPSHVLVGKQSVGLLERISRQRNATRSLGTREKLEYALKKVNTVSGRIKKKIRRRMWKIAHEFYQSRGRSLPRIFWDVREANYEAARSYRPQVYPGRVILFRASHPLKGCYQSPELGWEGLAAGGMEINEIPGSHGSIMREPGVLVLVDELKGYFGRIHSTHPVERRETSKVRFEILVAQREASLLLNTNADADN